MDEEVIDQSIVPSGSVQGEVMGKETTKNSYAIIGTRNPDEAQMEIAYRLAWAIAVLGGKIVRTGAAYGVDQRAMEGTGGKNLEVYLPWYSYNRHIIPVGADIFVYIPCTDNEWADSVHLYHPNPSRLSHAAFALHARNFGIVNGCKGVIALPQEDGGGGTGQGIRIANALGIKLLQANKGSVTDAPRWIGKALQEFGFASSDLRITL